MIDQAKRQTLAKLGGIASIPVVGSLPLMAQAATSQSSATPTASESTRVGGATSSHQRFQIELHTDLPQPYMRVTNMTKRVEFMRHVDQGVVESNGQYFDLNAALASSAYAIGAGRTRRIPIEPIDAVTASVKKRAYTHTSSMKVATLLHGNRTSGHSATSRIYVS